MVGSNVKNSDVEQIITPIIDENCEEDYEG